MRILFYNADTQHDDIWLSNLRAVLPQADIRTWHAGDHEPADYAVVWRPPAAVLQERAGLKAVFNLGAGVDAILQLGALPASLPLIRIDDGGMAIQMAEYATHAVLRYFRRFDDYERLADKATWEQLTPFDKPDFGVGILGIGVLGTRIATSLLHFGFPVHSWSRTAKDTPGVKSYAGAQQLDDFLAASRVLICMLPLTPETTGILNRSTLSALPRGSYLINVARGGHLVEADLLALINEGHIAGATLDVFGEEPLPPAHPFWQEPRISITPHISALTVRAEAARQVGGKIAALERGEVVAGTIDRTKGY